MNNARQRKMDREKEYRKNAYNQNNPLMFGFVTLKDLVKLILGVYIGCNFLYLTFNYCPPIESIYQKDYPYKLKDSNFLFAWWGKTLITAWHSSRYILKRVLNYFQVNKPWKQSFMIFLIGPFLSFISLIASFVVGFFTTLYGSFNYGSEDCQQTVVGLILTIIYLFTGILFSFAALVGLIQMFFLLYLILITPITKPKGQANVFNKFYEHKKLISLFFAILVTHNGFKYLNTKIGISMVVALVMSVILFVC